MKKILCGLLLMGSLFAQDFFKFSTIYGAYSFSSPITKEQTFQVTGGKLQEILDERDDHSIMTFGIRKLARFGYENKSEVFYDGSEVTINESATVGNIITGWEYVIEYSDHKEFEEKFIDQEFMLRYLGKNFLIKASYDYRGLEDLEFAGLDMRYKKNLGSNLALSLGVAGRSHPAYLDFLPIDLYWEEQGINPDDFIPFWLLAWDEAGYADGPYKDVWTEQYTQFGYVFWDWYWTDAEGNIVATTDEEFYEVVYSELVADYNEIYIKDLGYQNELSLSIGADYYKYNPKNWFHTWVTAYPITKGYSDYSFNYDVADNGMDFDLGLVYGWKLTNKFGIFLKARYLNMYDIQSYQANAGFNLLIY